MTSPPTSYTTSWDTTLLSTLRDPEALPFGGGWL